MKQTRLLRTLLVALCLLTGTSSVWADATNFGSSTKDKSPWDDNYRSSTYTISKGTSKTLNFTIETNTSEETWQKYWNWILEAKCGTYWLDTRGDDVAGETWCGNGLSPVSTYSDNFATAFTRENMDGATVALNVTRDANNNVVITSTSTKQGTTWWKKVSFTLPVDDDLTFNMTAEYSYGTILSFLPAGSTMSYDFTSFTNQSLDNSGVTAVTANSINYIYPTQLREELGSRFAFRYNAGHWDIASGLKWTTTNKKDDDFTILNVKAGDVVTLTTTSGTVFARVANQITGTHYAGTDQMKENTIATGDLPQWGVLISGQPYTVKANGNLYLQAKRNNWTSADGNIKAIDVDYTVISNITITTAALESVTSPSISSAVDGAKRTITITPGVSSVYSGTTTRYTLDGTVPTSTSEKYTAPFQIEETKTIKVITISNSSEKTESDIATQEVTAGEAITLNAPTVTMDLNAVGNYYVPTYNFSSDQSSLGEYTPASATISYSVAGDESIEGNSFTPTTKGGTVTVTVSADGYTSANTVFNVPAIVYNKVTTLDFTTATYPEGTYITTTSQKEGKAYETGNKIQQDIYAVSAPSALTGYMAFQGVYNGTSGSKGWWIRSNQGGLYTHGAPRSAAVLGRSASDIVAFNCSQDAANVMTYLNGGGVPDGNYTMLKSSNTKTYYATMTAEGKVGFCGNNTAGYITSIDIYSPVNTIPAEISTVGAATFVSNYALDFSNVAGLEAYIATTQNGANITFDKVGAVPAGTPLYLRGATADVPVVASADAVGENLLVAGTGAAVASEAGGKYNFILNKVDDVLGFYWAAGNTVAANRAYLSLSADPFAGGGAKGVNMIFNGETTGIYSVGAQSKEANVKGLYNLQGQRVYNPTKGLYIIDGKKVVIN